MDQHLYWDSHHGLSVFNTVTQRARAVCTNQQLLKEDEDYIRRALLRCSYPTCALNRLQANINHRLSANLAQNNPSRPLTNNSNNNYWNIHIVVPCTKVLSKRFKRVCDILGVHVHFKRGINTISNHLVVPKDKDNIINESGVINRFKCTQTGFKEEYIGESGRSLGDRFKEHLKNPGPIYKHGNTTGHHINVDSFSIVSGEVHIITRTIKEVHQGQWPTP